MERLEIYLFLLGIISVTLVVLTFFVPLLLLGTYKNLSYPILLPCRMRHTLSLVNYLSRRGA